ncbi:hypothetical protein HPC49_13145 [Pyxidicoccus fallax]|uniref:Peptidoglycan binding-like domain-containing protein n=1 Tax=Pyxidicoccus fallax TaxID=394095 RepID=A0A848LFG7_9BACT|nr:hypothetical protein [Pyxidicoccus fallax]NMO17214.1 hypothetical protein [Pyxidicoccus fallax]NPC79180.1 hypothetical protein [Pyxidicoccus fallax]
MPKQHKVTEGDCILSIAEQHGFKDYHTVWDDAANGALKKERPNPNTLVVGDAVEIPDVKPKQLGAATSQTAKFTLKQVKGARLRLVLLGADDKPLEGKSWELTAPVEATGKTGADGLIQVEPLPVKETQGTLKVTLREKASASASAAPASPPAPAYPPTIVPDEFKDAKPPEVDPELDAIEWELKLGSLPSYNHESGVKARLCNLGFLLAPDADATKTEDAVKRYQKVFLKQDAGSGKTADIQDDVRARYDTP